MRTLKCDVCKRTEPEVNCRYSRSKKWGWFKWSDDSQGGSDFPIDLCEQCWEGFGVFMQAALSKRSLGGRGVTHETPQRRKYSN